MRHPKQTFLAALLLTASVGNSFAQSNWTTRSSETINMLNSITWTGTQLVVVGSNGTVLTSPEGIAWTTQYPQTQNTINSVAWSGTVLVAGSYPNPITGKISASAATSIFSYGILTSPDGISWVAPFTGGSNVFRSICSQQLTGKLMAVGDGLGILISSDNGAHWNSSNLGGIYYLYSVVWTGAQAVVVGSSINTGTGTILTSPNGTIWTLRTSGTTYSLFSIGWSNSLFVTVGNNGTILTSSDGTMWSTRTSGVTASLRSAIWTGSQWVVVGTSGTILTSPDGIVWKSRTSGTIHSLYSVTWTGTQLVAVGDSGTILTSPQDPVAINPYLQTPNSSKHNTLYTITGRKMDLSKASDRKAQFIPLLNIAR